MVNNSKRRNSAIVLARFVAITGALVIIAVYGFALTVRGPDVGDNNGCRSTYSDAPALQYQRDEYQAIIDKADSVVEWRAAWSYFPPGWICSARGYADGERGALGVIHPSKWGGVAAAVGMALAVGGAVSMAGIWIREYRRSSRR